MFSIEFVVGFFASVGILLVLIVIGFFLDRSRKVKSKINKNTNTSSHTPYFIPSVEEDEFELREQEDRESNEDYIPDYEEAMRERFVQENYISDNTQDAEICESADDNSCTDN